MGVVLLQILQWILRIILFFLLLIAVLLAIILIVPIRYRAEGELLEKKAGVRGKITWFFYLIYMKFAYEEDLHIVVRVLGFKVYDSVQKLKEDKQSKSSDNTADETVGKADVSESSSNQTVEKTVAEEKTDINNTEAKQTDFGDSISKNEGKEYSLVDWEKEIDDYDD